MKRWRAILNFWICGVCATNTAWAVEPATASIDSQARQAPSLATSSVKPADQDSPIVIYRRGIRLSSEGRVEEAAAHFFAAAQKGVHLAEVDLAYLHSEAESALRDDPAAFAWFLLAIQHEPNPKLARILSRDKELVRQRMSSPEQAEAMRLSKTLLNNLGAVPAFVEAK